MAGGEGDHWDCAWGIPQRGDGASARALDNSGIVAPVAEREK